MQSISTSDDSIVSVEKLNLVFQTSVYRSWTLREVFTRAVSSPLKSFSNELDRLQVARDISFSVKRGEVVGIIGVNGSGKTSLCRCIAGMYAPTKGLVKVRGAVRAVFDTGIGIQPELTGRENAHLLSYLLFPGDPRRKELVDEALSFSELGQFVDVPFKVYSNGMQTRLCLSLVSALPADILILDEVFDGADAFFKDKIAARVKRMMRDSGAVLFVSHAEPQIREVCTRVLLLHHGQLLFDGPVDQGLALYAELGAQPGSPPVTGS